MSRVRARWVLGLGLVISGAAISCGSGDSTGLFTASDGGAGTVHGSSGASNQAGAHTGVAGDESGGAFNQAGSDQTSGAAGAGATSTDGGASGSPAGGSMGTAGKGGSTGKAGSGGGGAGGKNGGGGMSGGGAAGATGGAGAGGATAGAGGNGGVAGSGGAGAGGSSGSGGSSGGGGAGPVPCSDNAGCTLIQYCAKPDCSLGATGTCTARPTACAGSAETAICGCDGFTYHDACLLHFNGQNSLSAGACPRTGVGSTNTVTCVAPADPTCTAKPGGACGFRADTACGLQPAKGICWVLPSNCPTGGGTAKAAEICNVGPGPNSACESECTAVRDQVRYALTANCN